MMNNQDRVTMEDLCSWVVNNELKNFDPIAEAFKV